MYPSAFGRVCSLDIQLYASLYQRGNDSAACQLYSKQMHNLYNNCCKTCPTHRRLVHQTWPELCWQVYGFIWRSYRFHTIHHWPSCNLLRFLLAFVIQLCLTKTRGQNKLYRKLKPDKTQMVQNPIKSHSSLAPIEHCSTEEKNTKQLVRIPVCESG